MGVAGKPREEVGHVFVDEGVLVEVHAEFVQLFLRRQSPLEEEVGNFDERAVSGQIFDVVAPVAEDTPLTVDVRDVADTRARVAETVVEGDQPGLGPELADVDGLLAFRALEDGQFDLHIVEFQGDVAEQLRPGDSHVVCVLLSG